MIRIYDTKAHKKVDLVTMEQGKVKMYVCGPTVYNYIHIGNARTFISFDVIRRYLLWRGYDVVFVQNVTDVDDKIINKANEENRSTKEVAEKYTQAFINDMHSMNVLDPTVRPRATQEIDTMLALVQKLVNNGHAYVTKDGDVYFKVRSFKSYGSLSGRNIDEMEAGHRDLCTEGIEDRKNDPLDFVLWKAAKPGEPAWKSPWGLGRPGWHIECSCMSKKYLGLPFDIHGGGADLVFPHHENERAQSEAADGVTFARYWMHGGMLQINGEKMSKSLNNFFLLRDILEQVPADDLRFFMLQTHYRSPLDFSDERVSEAGVALERIRNTVRNLTWAINHASGEVDILDSFSTDKLIHCLQDDFMSAMDDDFNSAKAIGYIFDFVTEINALVMGKTLSLADVAFATQMRDVLAELMNVFGIDVAKEDKEEDILPTEVQELVAERVEARVNKDWARADEARDKLLKLGYIVKDTPQGSLVQHVQ